jgi:hypothetical protein
MPRGMGQSILPINAHLRLVSSARESAHPSKSFALQTLTSDRARHVVSIFVSFSITYF